MKGRKTLRRAGIVLALGALLLDRMEVIRFDGYTVAEKVAIARDYLWPRQRERNGLREDEVTVSDELLQTVVGEQVAGAVRKSHFDGLADAPQRVPKVAARIVVLRIRPELGREALAAMGRASGHSQEGKQRLRVAGRHERGSVVHTHVELAQQS